LNFSTVPRFVSGRITRAFPIVPAALEAGAKQAGTVSLALHYSQGRPAADDSCAQSFAGNTLDPAKKQSRGFRPGFGTSPINPTVYEQPRLSPQFKHL
jgi:hypothetical protein